MSFDFGPTQNLSNVQASAKSCAGGGGNTGYFKRDNENDEEEILKFNTKDYPDDSFVKETSTQEDEEQGLWALIKSIFADFFEMIKSLFRK